MRITDTSPVRGADPAEGRSPVEAESPVETQSPVEAESPVETQSPADPETFNRRKVYVEGATAGVRVPFVEVSLSPTPGRETVRNAPVHLYDTSGPGSDPLAAWRRCACPGSRGGGTSSSTRAGPRTCRDDGRGAVRRAGAPEAFPGPRRRPLVAGGAGPVTQLHYARRGEITTEMEFVALREQMDLPWCATRWPRAGPSSPPTSTIPSPSPWPSDGPSSSR